MKRLAIYALDAVMIAVIMASVIQCVRYAALCRRTNLEIQQKAKP